MMKIRILETYAAKALLAPGIIALVAWGGTSKAQDGDQITWVIDRESTNIVPINTTTFMSQAVGPKIFDGLVWFDEDLKAQPQLATEWAISPDGLIYTFKLRADVKWHDGQALTSADVAFSFERLKAAHPRGRVTFANVQKIETPDAQTVVVTLGKPTPYLLTALSSQESPIVPKHVFEKLDPAAVPPDTALIGTGPFRFGEWERGSHVTLDRNPDYWQKGEPHLDRLLVRIIPDAAARSAALEAGEIDIGEVGLSDIERFKTNQQFVVSEQSTVYSGPHHQIAINFENPVLANLKVRKAIAHSIDLESIKKLVYFGYGTVSPTPISASLGKFHNSDIKPYVVDIALANKLLDEAGYQKGGDGFRFKLRIALNPANDQRTGAIVQQTLKAIGIDGVLTLTDQAGYIKKVYSDRDFDLGIDALASTFDPTVGVQRVFWSKAFKVGVPFTNPGHYANPEVDRLLETAAVEPDEAKRRDLFLKFQEVVHADVPVIDFIDPPRLVVTRKGVEGFNQGAHGLSGNFAGTHVKQ